MPSQQTTQATAPYIPSRDIIDRHDYGVTKTRKASSTGGGRAWSDEEESYLIQTRLQKMPYKYIAAHLKKTELACRLHYHQLSHGSNRRKRAASVSSGTSNDHAIPTQVAGPSPTRETISRSASPPSSARSYSPPPSHFPNANCIQLPSIVGPAEVHRLPAILPKPSAMTLPHPSSSTQNYVSAMTDSSAPFHRPSHHRTTPPLRLDCSAPPAPSAPSGTVHTPSHVDLSRLHSIYSSHRTSFWTAIANEYGPNVSPTVLEQAWRTGTCCSPSTLTPITPLSSPSNYDRDGQAQPKGQDKTRISSILGIDADPRTARDRDIVRRMEQERFGVMQMAH